MASPVFSGGLSFSERENEPFSHTWAVSETNTDNGDSVSWEILDGLNIANFAVNRVGAGVDSTYEFTGTTPDSETQRDTTIRVTATNIDGTTVQDFALTANNVPEPVADEPDLTVTTGVEFSLRFSKNGPDDDTQRTVLIDGVIDPSFTTVSQGADGVTVTGTLDILGGTNRVLTLSLVQNGVTYTADAAITVQSVPAPTISGVTGLTVDENSPILVQYTVSGADSVEAASPNEAEFIATGTGISIQSVGPTTYNLIAVAPDAETITSAVITISAVNETGQTDLDLTITIRNVPELDGPATATVETGGTLSLVYDRNGPQDSGTETVLLDGALDPNVTIVTQGVDRLAVSAFFDIANGTSQTLTVGVVRNGVNYTYDTVVTVDPASAPTISGATTLDGDENSPIVETYTIVGATTASAASDLDVPGLEFVDNLDGTWTLLGTIPDADIQAPTTITITATGPGGSSTLNVPITSRNIPEPDGPATLIAQSGEEFTYRVFKNGPDQGFRVEPVAMTATATTGDGIDVTGTLLAENGGTQSVTLFITNLGIEYPFATVVTVESESPPPIVSDTPTLSVQTGVQFTVTFTKNEPVDSFAFSDPGFTVVETEFSFSATGTLDIANGASQVLSLTVTIGGVATTASTTVTVSSDVVLDPVIYAPTVYNTIEGVGFGFDVQIENFVNPVVSGVAGASIAFSTAGSRLDYEYQVMVPAQTGAQTLNLLITDNSVTHNVVINILANELPVITAPDTASAAGGVDVVIPFTTDSMMGTPSTDVGYIIERDEPVGLYSLLPLTVTGPTDSRNYRTNYWLEGNAYRAATWNVLEISDGVYDFSYLDWIVQQSVNDNLKFSWLQLVDPSGWPDFIINDPEIETWVDTLDGLTKPIPWNAKLLQKWRDLNEAVANALVPNVGGGLVRLADHSLFTVLHPIFPGWPRNAMRDGIGAGGTTPVSSLPGFTRENMQTSLVFCMGLASELFPRQILNLSLWNIQDGSTNPDLWEDARATILSYPKSTLFQDNLWYGTDQPGAEYGLGPNPEGMGEVFLDATTPSGHSSFNGMQHLAAWTEHSPDRTDQLQIGTMMEGVIEAERVYGMSYHEIYVGDTDYATTEAEAVTWLKQKQRRWDLHILSAELVDGQTTTATITAVDLAGGGTTIQALSIAVGDTPSVDIPITVTIPTATGGPTSYTLTVALGSTYNNLNLVSINSDGDTVPGAATLTGTVNTGQAGVYVQTVVAGEGYTLTAPVSLIVTVQDEPDQIPDIRGGVDIVNLYSPFARVFLTRDNRFIFAADFEGDYIDFTNATRMELLNRRGELITDELTAINITENGATIEAVEVHLPSGEYSRYPIALTFVVYDTAHPNGQVVTHWRDEKLIMRVVND